METTEQSAVSFESFAQPLPLAQQEAAWKAHVALCLEDEPAGMPMGSVYATLALAAFTLFAGNAWFDWFIPRCNIEETLLVGGGLLVALRLFFSHPALALLLVFCLGDPAFDTYGHCILGL